ncbi:MULTISPECIES: response regulator transcription factor [unclassified Microbacterium]|uniref:response regulator n=1 Tax=unclassified Microbacterium TaxID=2609290 RepID=UPI001D266D2A|nr:MULTISPECIES: response regulator transcription factor [unclassified Microbacterium]MBT9607928.1 response regulator transcription factor [Microbacterium sp.]CAH0301400.1 Transcriptional regulatory protein LiaR [Microbacterium sp. Bi128]
MPRTRSIRVLIVDDNRTVRRGLRIQLDQAEGIRVIGEAANGADAVAIGVAERPDVVLMDLQMPGMSGLEATYRLLGAAVKWVPAIVVMTSHAGDRFVLSALDAGAVGYLIKGHDTERLTDAVRAAVRGEALVSSRVMTPVLRELAQRRPGQAEWVEATTLSPAEEKVVAALSRGFTGNDDIALMLHLSVNTVRSHIRSALAKTGTSDRTQLALWGVRHRLDRAPR